MHFSRWTTLAGALCLVLSAQTNRVTKTVDNDDRITLSGHMHPRLRLGTDQGRVAADLTIQHVTLNFSTSPSQKADLAQLLADQQDPKSTHYHQWLTPEEYAQRFGLSDADLTAVSNWVKAQGLSIDSVARGRSWIAVTGSAAQMENAFRTELYNYVVDA